jgi:hypothetical protein
MIRQLKKRIVDQEKRVVRATQYLEELRESLKACEPLSTDLNYYAKGGDARAVLLSPKKRSEIAKHAVTKRWATKPFPVKRR